MRSDFEYCLKLRSNFPKSCEAFLVMLDSYPAFFYFTGMSQTLNCVEHLAFESCARAQTKRIRLQCVRFAELSTRELKNSI